MPGRSVTHVSAPGAPAPPSVVGPAAPAPAAGAVRSNLRFPGRSAIPPLRRLRATELTPPPCLTRRDPAANRTPRQAGSANPAGVQGSFLNATMPLFLPDPPMGRLRRRISQRSEGDPREIEGPLPVLRTPARG